MRDYYVVQVVTESGKVLTSSMQLLEDAEKLHLEMVMMGLRSSVLFVCQQ